MDKNIPNPSSAGKIKIGFQVCVHACAHAQNMSKNIHRILEAAVP